MELKGNTRGGEGEKFTIYMLLADGFAACTRFSFQVAYRALTAAAIPIIALIQCGYDTVQVTDKSIS